MYIFKSACGVYYTRLCLPKVLKDSGFPFDVKVSLYTKDRTTAMDRGIDMIAILRPIIRSTCPSSSITDFQERVGNAIESQRIQQSIDAPQRLISPPTQSKQTEAKGSPNQTNALELLDAFIKSKRLEKISDLSVHQLNQRSSHFIKTMKVAYIEQVTPSLAMRYRDNLLAEGRSHKSNKAYLAAIKQFCGWCVATERLTKQPFDHIKLPKPNAASANQARPRWSKEQLKKCFNPSTFNQSNEQLKWSLLLMAYHGCRPAEACQLHVSDVCLKTMTLSVSDASPDQSVKNAHSRRKIPLHLSFNCLGFKQYLVKRQQSNQVKLFDFKAKGMSNCAKELTVDFGKLLTSRGFEVGDRPTAYSFRHTFIDELKKQHIAEHIVAQIVGHSHSSLTFGHYGKVLSVDLLRKVINRVSFPELEHLFC